MSTNTTNVNFFLIPNDVFEYKLKPREYIVYCYLIRCGDASRQSFPSRKNIAKMCCMSVPTVDSAIRSLEEMGMISVKHRNDETNGNHLSHLYTISKVW